jgi:hypothetical protein
VIIDCCGNHLAMARNEHTADQLDSIAGELKAASDTLKALTAAMRESGIPYALIHGESVKNLHLQKVIDWVGAANVDTRSQIRAHTLQIQSDAALQKQKNERQKQKAAAKKKTTKKK